MDMNNAGTDIGFDVIESDDSSFNFFEEFTKSKDGGAASLTSKPDPANDNATDDKSKDDKSVATTTPGNTNNKRFEVKDDSGKADEGAIDNDALLDLIKKSQTKGDASKSGANSSNTTPAKGAPAAADAGTGANDAKESQMTAIYKHLTEDLGLLPGLPEGEEFEGTEESLADWIMAVREEEKVGTATQFIKESFANQKHNEQLALDFFDFISNKGGGVEDFLNTRKHDHITAEYLNVDDEDAKEARSETILRELHLSMGWEAASIDSYIANLKKSGTLETTAKIALPQFIKTNEAKKVIANQQAAANTQRKDLEVRTHNNEILSLIDNSKEFLSFNISNVKEKNDLKRYMYLPIVDMGNGVKVPQFMADKMAAAKNPAHTLFQALTLKNKGLDAANIKNKAVNDTKLTLQQKLERLAEGKKLEQPSSEGSGSVAAGVEQPKNFIDFDNIQFVN